MIHLERSVSCFGICLSLMGIGFNIASPLWKSSSTRTSKVKTLVTSEGLWVRYITEMDGSTHYEAFEQPFFAQPAYLQAQRAMMILACIFIVSSVITSTVSLPCTSALNEKAKRYAAMTAGVLAILAGILTLVSVSWYSSGIVFEYFNPNLSGAQFKYEFGPALYVGWVSSILAIIAGILLLCCNCGATDEADDYPYNYGPAKPVSANRPNTEYV